MNEIKHMAAALHRFFARHDIPYDGVKLIINITDRRAAARFDMAVKQELTPDLLYSGSRLFDIRRFTLNGIEMRVESPVHDPLSWRV